LVKRSEFNHITDFIYGTHAPFHIRVPPKKTQTASMLFLCGEIPYAACVLGS